MKLNKKQHNGLLLVLYIARAGRCTLTEASEQLGLTEPFLRQIANTLRFSGIIHAVRGPGGGYELVGEPTIGQVLFSLGFVIDNPYRMSTVPEKRALGQLLSSFSGAVAPIMRRKVGVLNLELAANESAAMAGIEFNTVN
jgi:hypothetical protein